MCGYVRIYKEAWQKAQAQPIRTYVRTYARAYVHIYVIYTKSLLVCIYINHVYVYVKRKVNLYVCTCARTYVYTHVRTDVHIYDVLYVINTTRPGRTHKLNPCTYYIQGTCVYVRKEAWQTAQAQPMYVLTYVHTIHVVYARRPGRQHKLNPCTYVRTHIRGICKEAWQTAQAQPMYVRTYVRTCVHIYNVHTHVVHIGRPGRKHKLNSCTRQGGLEYNVGSTLV